MSSEPSAFEQNPFFKRLAFYTEAFGKSIILLKFRKRGDRMLISKQHPRILCRRIRARGRHFPGNRQKDPEAIRARNKTTTCRTPASECDPYHTHRFFCRFQAAKTVHDFFILIEPATIGFPALLVTEAGMR